MSDPELLRMASRAASLREDMAQAECGSHDDAAGLRSLCVALVSGASAPLEGYREWPQPVDELLHRWAGVDPADLAVHLRLGQLLLALVESLPDRFEQAGLPAEFADEYSRTASRIMARIAGQKLWQHGVDDDIFRKDLALLCLRLVPCVSHVVCRYSGVPQRTLLLPRNLASGASVRVVFALRGRLWPLMANHVHPEMTDRFDAAGREASYRLICALLRHWPDCAGLVGASWYYDRAVGAISPHLAYLRDVPEERGALFLDAGSPAEAMANAVVRSQQRRARVEAGTYKPRTVMLVWPRRALLAHLQPQPAPRAVA